MDYDDDEDVEGRPVRSSEGVIFPGSVWSLKSMPMDCAPWNHGVIFGRILHHTCHHVPPLVGSKVSEWLKFGKEQLRR